MSVRELIAKLSTMDPDRIVILQKDSEGNGYSPLEDLDDNASYIAYNSWSGEVRLQELTGTHIMGGFTTEDTDYENEGVPCVVFVPIN